MFGKHDAGWVRVFHFVAALSMLLTVCGPALQPSRVLAADPETASATASVGAPCRHVADGLELEATVSRLLCRPSDGPSLWSWVGWSRTTEKGK